MNKLPFNEILKAIGVFAVGMAVVLTVAKLTDYLDKPEPIVIPAEVLPPKIVTCLSDYDSFESTTKRVLLLEDKLSNGTEKTLKGYTVTLQRTALTSDVACGYLYYTVSFNHKPIEQKYMVLYMNPSGGQLGGHIFPDENRGAIVNEIKARVGSTTEIVMPLDAITYDGLERQPIRVSNWAALLNVSNEIKFDIALSADTPLGNIDSVGFAFKCVNKETRKEDDACLISVIDTQPYKSP